MPNIDITQESFNVISKLLSREEKRLMRKIDQWEEDIEDGSPGSEVMNAHLDALYDKLLKVQTAQMELLPRAG